MSKSNQVSFRKKLSWIGWMFVCTGVVCNEWVLTKTLSPDGILEIQTRGAVWLFDIVFMVLGICLVQLGKLVASQKGFRHLSQAYPRTLACFIGLVLTVILVLCTEGIFYGLNNYAKEKRVEETSWIRIPAINEDGSVGDNPPRRVQGGTIEDKLLGYKLPKNAQISDKMELDGKLIYKGTYTTDAYNRRITPIDHLEQRNDFLLFFGCSMTFGLRVNDNETMPFYIAQYASHYRPYNYGVYGYGPQHMLAQLQSEDLKKEINEKHGILIYTFIDHHIDRAIGTLRVYNQWGLRIPFYTIDDHDRLVRKGSFTSGRPFLSLLYWGMGKSQILKAYGVNVPSRIREDHIRLTARIIEESRNAFKKQFPSGEFYLLLYPGVRRGKEMIPYFERAGVKYLDYSSLIKWPYQEFTIEDDSHPTAKGHRIVAAQLAQDLGKLDIIQNNNQRESQTLLTAAQKWRVIVSILHYSLKSDFIGNSVYSAYDALSHVGRRTLQFLNSDGVNGGRVSTVATRVSGYLCKVATGALQRAEDACR